MFALYVCTGKLMLNAEHSLRNLDYCGTSPPGSRMVDINISACATGSRRTCAWVLAGPFTAWCLYNWALLGETIADALDAVLEHSHCLGGLLDSNVGVSLVREWIAYAHLVRFVGRAGVAGRTTGSQTFATISQGFFVGRCLTGLASSFFSQPHVGSGRLMGIQVGIETFRSDSGYKESFNWAMTDLCCFLQLSIATSRAVTPSHPSVFVGSACSLCSLTPPNTNSTPTKISAQCLAAALTLIRPPMQWYAPR
jgi:hypothetical protein